MAVIEIKNVAKNFGAYQAFAGHQPDHRRSGIHGASGRIRMRQDHVVADHRRA